MSRSSSKTCWHSRSSQPASTSRPSRISGTASLNRVQVSSCSPAPRSRWLAVISAVMSRHCCHRPSVSAELRPVSRMTSRTLHGSTVSLAPGRAGNCAIWPRSTLVWASTRSCSPIAPRICSRRAWSLSWVHGPSPARSLYPAFCPATASAAATTPGDRSRMRACSSTAAAVSQSARRSKYGAAARPAATTKALSSPPARSRAPCRRRGRTRPGRHPAQRLTRRLPDSTTVAPGQTASPGGGVGHFLTAAMRVPGRLDPSARQPVCLR